MIHFMKTFIYITNKIRPDRTGMKTDNNRATDLRRSAKLLRFLYSVCIDGLEVKDVTSRDLIH